MNNLEIDVVDQDTAVNEVQTDGVEFHASRNGREIDAVMTVSEVSKYLKIAKSTVYKLSQEGKLPGRKIGGAWRFSSRVLEAWLAEGMFERIEENAADGEGMEA